MSVDVRTVGGISPKKVPPSKKEDFKLSMEEVEISGKELAKSVVSFDVQNYIKSTVLELTDPIVKKSS